MTKQISINEIRIDGGTQLRLAIDYVTVDDYAAAFAAGAKFPPLVVYYDGVTYWLADGFHRWHAAKKAEVDKLTCEVHQGSQRDAILYAAGANDTNGLRRTRADKRVAVMALLHDPEWTKRSNNWIATAAKVSDDMVADWRKQSGFDSETGKMGKVVGKNGVAQSAKKIKHKPKKKHDLHIPPIDADEPPKKLQIAVQDIGVTIGHHRAAILAKCDDVELIDKYADDKRFVRMLAELVEAGRKMTMNAIDKASVIHTLNKVANESAEAIEEAEAA